MGFAGRLEGIAPSDIFQIISQNKMTGTLIARCSDRTAMVIFKNGQVFEAASDSPKESLGHFLVSRGLVSEGVIEAAGERRKLEPDQPLGAILMEMGAISGKALEAEVRQQIGAIVHRLMSCDDGFITFDRGEIAIKRKLHTREFVLPSGVSPEYLIMERARVLDEERRSGIDRRALKSAQTPEVVWDGRERRKAAGRGPTNGGFGLHLRGLGRSTAAIVRSTANTVVRKTKVLSGNAADLIRAFSPDGRALIAAGIGGIAAGAALIVLTVFTPRTSDGGFVVTGRVVNIRANPATTAKSVAKVAQGETVSHVSTKEGWHKVRTRAGKTGWVWHKLVEQKETKGRAFGYGGIGGGLLLIAGAVLLAAGIMRKRRTATTTG